ncbi:MAG: VOC family protein [Gordonibacter sp.]
MKFEPQHMGIYCYDIDESIEFYQRVLGLELYFTALAIDPDKPDERLKMAWMRNPEGVTIELIEQDEKQFLDVNPQVMNHVTLRVDDMDEAVEHLKAHNIVIEIGPFDPPLEFIHPSGKEHDLFPVCSDRGLNMRICFFRGPSGERFEFMQDNISGL